jgi:hypothetical protein
MTQRKFTTKHYILLFLFIALAGYALFQARFLVLGPRLKITSPENGSHVAGSVINVEGVAKNIAWISLNGRQIFTDERGYWSEKLIVPSGASIMTVETRDRFGRERKKSIQVVN